MNSQMTDLALASRWPGCDARGSGAARSPCWSRSPARARRPKPPPEQRRKVRRERVLGVANTVVACMKILLSQGTEAVRRASMAGRYKRELIVPPKRDG